MNWNQTGMPAALVGRLGQKREIAEFKAVLNDAQNHILQPVDVESMAQELVEAGGREFVDMVRELTTALAQAKNELEDANRRYERLVAELDRRGVGLADERQPQPEAKSTPAEEQTKGAASAKSKTPEDGLAEWEEWNRRFQSLLDG